MARDYFINGPTLVKVDGSELGLSDSPIRVSPNFRHLDIVVDAFGSEGGGVPPEIQFMLADVIISMSLVHIDRSVLDTCIRKSMGGGSTAGTLPITGARMGSGSTNNFQILGLTSPVGSKPWRFPSAYLIGGPLELPVGTSRSVFGLQWRAVPYQLDPYGGGNGALGTVLWDHTSV